MDNELSTRERKRKLFSWTGVAIIIHRGVATVGRCRNGNLTGKGSARNGGDSRLNGGSQVPCFVNRFNP